MQLIIDHPAHLRVYIAWNTFRKRYIAQDHTRPTSIGLVTFATHFGMHTFEWWASHNERVSKSLMSKSRAYRKDSETN